MNIVLSARNFWLSQFLCPESNLINYFNPTLLETITHQECWLVHSYKIDRSNVLLSSWNQDVGSWFLLSVCQRPNQLLKINFKLMKGISQIFAKNKINQISCGGHSWVFVAGFVVINVFSSLLFPPIFRALLRSKPIVAAFGFQAVASP